MSVLVCENLVKKRRKTEIIKNFTYNFLENQTYALVGKYDAYLNDLLELFSNKQKPTSGNIYLDGIPLNKFKHLNANICYIDNLYFPRFIKVIHIFKMMSTFYPNWDTYYAYELAQQFDIKHTDYYYELPNNKKSILKGILSLATRASITILNNPLKDADIKERYDFYNYLYKHNEIYPRTFIICTANIDEIDFLVDDLLLIDSGKLIDHFILKEMKHNFRYLSGKTEVLKSLINGVKVIGVEERGKNLTVCVRHKLSKDEIRKYQKYLIKISEVPIQKVIVYLMNLREIKGIDQ